MQSVTRARDASPVRDDDHHVSQSQQPIGLETGFTNCATVRPIQLTRIANMNDKHKVVISGAAGRLPLSDSLDEFKHNLMNGVDMVTADDSRWPAGMWGLPTRNGKMKNIDKFDAEFFGVAESEANFIDPQERLMLETTYEALVDAGMNPAEMRGSNTGFYFGSCFQETHRMFDDPQSTPDKIRTLVTRVSRFFEFKGPIIQTDTACGSSFTALNEAFSAIQTGLCRYAIVAGTNTLFRPRVSLQFKDLKMITKDGKCKCLDSSANGYVRSEACVVFLLQRSSDAKRIHATILNSKSNSDGYKVEGITFPSIKGQRTLVQEVYDEVGVDPVDINYIEAHVTGTSAGDPVEMDAMYDVICPRKSSADPVLVGCLKSNMGHTEGASGLCALAKALIIFQTGFIPANLHFKEPNQRMKGLRDGRMKPVTQLTKFSGELIPVNCFGFGGANVHVLTKIFEPVRPKPVRITVPHPRLIQLAGRTADSVNHIANQIKSDHNQYLTNDFLSLVNDFATISHEEGMRFRNFLIVEDEVNGSGFSIESVNPVQVMPKEVNFVFTGTKGADCDRTFEQFMEMPIFRTTIKNLEDIVGEQFSKSSSKLRRIASQLAMADVLIALDIVPNHIDAISEGWLAAAYLEGCLTINDAILIANAINTINCRDQLITEIDKLIVFPIKMSSKLVHGSEQFYTAHFLVEHLFNPVPATEPNQEQITIQISSNGLFSLSEPNHELSSSKFSAIKNFLQVIGRLYQNGSNCAISKLYPAVNYPMPSSTPSLSSLIKWKHDKTFPLAPYLVQSTNYHFQTSRNLAFHFDGRLIEDAFFFDHRIDGRVLFPATGYLMMAWIAFTKLNNVAIYDRAIEFRDISFERATVMSKKDLTKLNLRINEDSGAFIIKEGDNQVVKGSVHFYDRDYQEPIAVRLEPKPDDCITLEARDIYKEFRIRGYDYGQFFQGLASSRSDGRQGSLVWRQVINSQSYKDTWGQMDTEEEQSLLWLRSWTTFSDAMFQLLLMSNGDVTRNLFVPRRLESVICFPELLRQNIQESPSFKDAITLNNASTLTAFADPDENLVWTKGLTIKGLKTSLLKRRQQFVRLKKYYFSPHFERNCLDSSNDIRDVEDYYEEVLSMATKCNSIGSGNVIDWEPSKFDLNEDKHSLLRVLTNRICGSETGLLNHDAIERDLLIGKFESDWYFQEHLLKPHLELLLFESVHDTSVTKLDVLEYNSSNFVLNKSLMSMSDESLLYDSVNYNWTLMHPNPIDLEPNSISNVKTVLELNPEQVDNSTLPALQLIVYRSEPRTGFTDCSRSKSNIEQLFSKFFKQTKESGFLMVVTKSKLMAPELDKALGSLGLSQFSSEEPDLLIAAAESAGYALISQKTLFGAILPLTTILFKKCPSNIDLEKNVVMEIGVDNYQQWFDEIKEELSKLKDDPQRRLWLTPKVEDPQGITGLLGFIKSIRFEPNYDRVRLLIDWTATAKPDLAHEKYRRLVQRDLVYNVYGGEKLGWGNYESASLPKMAQHDSSLVKQMDHVYLKAMKPGDLSSFTWCQADLGHVPAHQLASVYYAPLNFRDIMFATGRLAPEAIPGIPTEVAQDSILGLEFAGRDCNGNRVMGVVPYKAIGSSVVLSDMDLIWPIPKQWTMEEAATVPCVYATAYYALVVRGNLVKDESVLIHSGAGGVGLASIAIALSIGCKVFTTVGSDKKRQYLLKEFPELRDENILYSRDTKFEDDVLIATNGSGVDVILNSLAEEMLQAGLRILAPGGRFLEIGKVDFINDNQLMAWQMDENRTFHGVLLDSLFRYSNDDYFPQRLIDEKKQLQCLVMQGIKEGVVKPLNRTVFAKNDVEDAFRFMSSGKHIGKVVIKIREEETPDGPLLNDEQLATPALKVTYCDPFKSYIVIGGLGGFGLEVVNWLATRGAKNIVISARRGIREPYQQFCVNRLRKSGVRVVISHAVCHEERGARAIIEAASELGPVGGMFNTAVVYEDCLFDNMTLESFEKVMQPKLVASRHFDVLTRKMCPNLDYFVTFSSISCGRGNGGQTNYNFANSTMDSICERRVADGLPGTSIQWGVVGDVGIVTEKSQSTEVNLLGATSQRLHSLLDSMDRFLQSGFSTALSYVKADKSGNASGDSIDLLKMVSRIFGLKDISTLDPLATLGSLGIDSLIAVEMKQLLERVTGNAMTVKEIRDLNVSALIELSGKQAAEKK